MVIFTIFLTSLYAVPSAQSYQFGSDPKKWSDSEVESFLFMSQVQNKTGLNRNSNLCIEMTEPVPGGKQSMRIISKVGDNGKGGLFQTGKAEIAKGSPEEQDLNRIRQIAKMASGYQSAIMNYDETAGAPTVNHDTKSYMTAQVIGYTDGEGISGTLSASLSNSGQSFSSNKQLGMYRANYLAQELGLADSFGQVKRSSIQAESAMRDKKFAPIRNCATWRTAEVRMSFQTGSKITDENTWAMSTQMAPEKQRLMMQYEAARQVREALSTLNNSVMKVESPWPSPSPGATPHPDRPYYEMGTEYKNFCTTALKWFQQPRTLGQSSRYFYFDHCKAAGTTSGSAACAFNCDQGNLYLSPAGLNNGGPIAFRPMFTMVDAAKLKPNTEPVTHQQFEELAKLAVRDNGILASLKPMQDQRATQLDQALKSAFPECASDSKSFQDLKTLVAQVEPVIGECRFQSPYSAITADNKCAQAATALSPGGSGLSQGGKSGKLMKCINMKRVMDSMYSLGECRPGAEFNKVTFPHMNVNIGCKFCGSGWSTHSGAASFKERYDGSITHFHDQNTTSQSPTFGNLQKPGVHQISNCADCSCANKSQKLAKIFTVEEASKDKSVIDSIDKNSCYCTPPIAPSCAVGPQGATGESEYSSLGQRYFYNSCSENFVDVSSIAPSANQKDVQILALVKQFNSGCGTDPKQCSQNLSQARAKVNSMLCENQGVKVPTDDPVRDCAQENNQVAPDAE